MMTNLDLYDKTRERMEIWDRRLEGGLDGGDVADVLDDWDTDVQRYITRISELEEIIEKSKNE